MKSLGSRKLHTRRLVVKLLSSRMAMAANTLAEWPTRWPVPGTQQVSSLQHVDQHPALLKAIAVNEDAVIKHVRETGQIPAGVKIIRTQTTEDSNITKLDIFHGPATIREDDR